MKKIIFINIVIFAAIFSACTKNETDSLAVEEYQFTYSECNTDSVSIEPTDIGGNEIDNINQNELISVIECYHHIRDILGGRYNNVTEYSELRELEKEYGVNNNYYNENVMYYEFKPTDKFNDIKNDFFRTDFNYSLLSEDMSISDYWNMTETYLSHEYTQKLINEYFMDVLDESGYIRPAKYWFNNGKILQSRESEYIYGGTNDYNDIEFDYDGNNIIATVLRKYEKGNSYVQYLFVQEDDIWKISNIYYLD